MSKRTRRWLVLAGLVWLVASGVPALAQENPGGKETAPLIKGQRVYTCGHSFHFYAPPILTDMAKGAGIQDHVAVGLSSIGGSRVMQHWDKDGAKNKPKEALKTGKVDVLTLSPLNLPDDGIENFARLALECNPKSRITVQESWLSYDAYDSVSPLKNRKVDRNAQTGPGLRKLHEPYFKEFEELMRNLNKKLGKDAIFVVPCGHAVLALREKVIAGQAPGVKAQADLFLDPIGHPKPALQALAVYCHFAVIYQTSPVGRPMPSVLAKANLQDGEKLNRLLQELAWDAVVKHPMSGVKAK